jgi:ABC-type multidrug transport system ATPase subunit
VIPAGAITALIDLNDSGKSTLLNLLAFMSAPDTGTLTFF